jgi:hypothetical protein
MSRTPPRFAALADFLAAHTRGEISREAYVIVSTCSCEVEILCPVGELSAEDIELDDDTREREVLFRAPTADMFAVAFAEALGMKGWIS